MARTNKIALFSIDMLHMQATGSAPAEMSVNSHGAMTHHVPGMFEIYEDQNGKAWPVTTFIADAELLDFLCTSMEAETIEGTLTLIGRAHLPNRNALKTFREACIIAENFQKTTKGADNAYNPN